MRIAIYLTSFAFLIAGLWPCPSVAHGGDENGTTPRPAVRPRPSTFEFGGIVKIILPAQPDNTYSVGDIVHQIEGATGRQFEVPEVILPKRLVVFSPSKGADAGDLLYLLAFATRTQWFVGDDQAITLMSRPFFDEAIDLATASLNKSYRKVIQFLIKEFPAVMDENLGNRFVLPQRRWGDLAEDEQKWVLAMLSAKPVRGDAEQVKALLTGTDNQRVTIEYVLGAFVIIQHNFLSRSGQTISSPRIVQPDPKP